MPVKVRIPQNGRVARRKVSDTANKTRPTYRKHEIIDLDGNKIPDDKIARSPQGAAAMVPTDDFIEDVSALIKQGNYLGTAVRACGIGLSTFNGWMKAVSEEALSKIHTEEDFKKLAPHMKLAEAVVVAAAQAEVDRVDIIDKAAQLGQWTSAAWWLERRFPERWGKRGFVDHSVHGRLEHVHSLAKGLQEDKNFANEAIDLFESSSESTDG